ALKFGRITQVLNQLLHFFLRFVHASYISKGGLDLVFTQQARLALAKAHGAATAASSALHLAHKEHENRNDQQNGETRYQQLLPEARLLHFHPFVADLMSFQVLKQRHIGEVGRADGGESRTILALTNNFALINL